MSEPYVKGTRPDFGDPGPSVTTTVGRVPMIVGTVPAESEMDAIALAYCREIDACRKEIQFAEEGERRAHEALLGLKSKLRKLELRYGHHMRDVQP